MQSIDIKDVSISGKVRKPGLQHDSKQVHVT